MKEILETAAKIEALGLKWTSLASKHSVSMKMAHDDRNELAGEVFATRKNLDGALSHIVDVARRIARPTEAEADADTLQICALHSLQTND